MNGRLEKENELEIKTYSVLRTLPDFVEEWYEHMEASAKTASSRLDFIYKIKKYLKSIKKTTIKVRIEELTYKSVVNYMKQIKTKSNKNGEEVATSGSYQKSVWAALNSFFKFLVKHKYIQENPMDDIEVSKKKDITRINRNRKYLTIEDFNKIIEATNNQENLCERARDKAILLVFMSTGIRRRALVQINIQDINFQKKMITVIDKEDAERDCYLTDQALEAIQDYLEYRGKKKGALFLSGRNKRISEGEIYYLVNKYSEQGLGYAISPHKLRAGFCTILYEKTKDLRLVQEIVGHANISTTQRYAVINNDKEQKINDIFNQIKI